MAEWGNGIKRVFLQGVEAFGKKASELAKGAQQRLKELNAERQLEQLHSQIIQESRQAWQNGEVLPQRLSDLLLELDQLESLLKKPEPEEETPKELEYPENTEETDG